MSTSIQRERENQQDDPKWYDKCEKDVFKEYDSTENDEDSITAL